MKPTNTDNISCIIFGHNFYKPQNEVYKNDQLKCKHCNTTVIMDKHGDFNTSGADKTFENTLRKLFLLKRRIA
ncbi:hypothetical protein [uncultured Winogradskyella sp.]|uniref:hypothetical protein n=1 Tax=uncultured Winogradskyella sp. TaxID=395353 RepID=UPI002627AAF6|nr:hypothetical protein [uncultured Winogradskyella sp.]